MPTKFALAKLEVSTPDGSRLVFYFDGNGKITRENGSFDSPVPNAFSLVQVQDCPFATPTCKSVCYVHKLEKAEEEIHAAYRHNSVVMRQVIENEPWFRDSVPAFSDWIQKHCPLGFRWHVSGDIISEKHALFVREVCCRASTVPFWIYTRSFACLGPLLHPRPRNLIINLSADKDNYQDALCFHQDFGLRICYLTVEGEIPDNLPEDSVIFPSYELRGRDMSRPKDAPWWQSLNQQQRKMVCPPDFFGQSETLRCGPCKKCLI
jgi:hypothetical protein